MFMKMSASYQACSTKSSTLKSDQVVLKGEVADEDTRNSMKPGQVYTVDDAIEKLGFGPFQIIIFFFCGLLWLADAMELMILSILSPAVKCQWDLSSMEEAIITSVVFVGALIGSLFWGVFGDIFGRKKGNGCYEYSSFGMWCTQCFKINY